jgi:hypothetical protein
MKYVLHSHFRKPVVEPAIKHGVTAAEYCALGQNFPRGDVRRVMSRSELMDFAKCPSKWKRGNPKRETDSMEWGSLVDCLLLTPERFEMDYAVAPETYVNAPIKYALTTEFPGGEWNPRKKPCQIWKKQTEEVGFEVLTPEALAEASKPKEWNWNATLCREWRASQEAQGKAVIKAEDASEAWKAVHRFKEDEKLSAFLKVSKRQVQVRVDYHDPDTGLVIPVKMLVDLAPDPASEFGDILGDLKTARNASPRAWSKAVAEHNYHVQAAMYLDGYNAATGLEYKKWAHLIQENVSPYETGRRILSSDFIQIGRAEYMRALVDYCFALKHDLWEGYDDNEPDGWGIVEPEAWMLGNSDL